MMPYVKNMTSRSVKRSINLGRIRMSVKNKRRIRCTMEKRRSTGMADTMEKL